jgi:cell division septal protein FtsQ
MISRGKEKGGTSAKGKQSWRELAGPSRGRINSPQAHRRRQVKWLKLAGCLGLLVAIICGSIWALVLFKNREENMNLMPSSTPIKHLVFMTDGVLPNAWLSSVVDLRPGLSIMEADIYALKRGIEAEGQVESASVERVFPGALHIRVKERNPVLRLVTAEKGGVRRRHIVARDGTVYQGIGYSQATLQNLPYIQPYQKADQSYFPMKGIERVADLLERARQNEPQLFKTWQVVSLEHYSGDLELPGQVIEIRSKLVARIIFSASSDFDRQLDRLVYILDYVRNHGNPSVERIDLSLRGSVAVQFSSGRIGTF